MTSCPEPGLRLALERKRQAEVRGAIIAADAEHARRLASAEEAYKATVAMAAVEFERGCRVGSDLTSAFKRVGWVTSRSEWTGQ
jgi:hypothetical protein